MMTLECCKDAEKETRPVEIIGVSSRGWDDLGPGEKIERAREIIKQQRERIEYLSDQLYCIKIALLNHAHTNGGAIVMPLTLDTLVGSNRNKLDDGCSADRKSVYF